MPRYSIILPVYNGSDYLEEAICSVLDQTFTDFELLVINDGSTDGSGKIAKRYAESDSRVLYYRREHTGLSGTLNYGLEISRGEFIARIDADDRWLPDKLKIQDDLLMGSPDIGLVGASVFFINKSGKRLRALSGFNHGKGMDPGELRKNILRNNPVCSSTLVFNRSLQEKTGVFDTSLHTSMDYDFIMKALAHASGMIIAEPLAEYRISGTMMTLQHREQMIGESVRIRLRGLKIHRPGCITRFFVYRDVCGLTAGKFLHKMTGKSSFSRYLESFLL